MLSHKISPWRNDFPIFHSKMNGRDLVYLDTASSAQKPLSVIKTLTNAYTEEYANIHRGLYAFSQNMTAKFEQVRSHLKSFLNLPQAFEVVFTRNATESFNVIAHSWGSIFLQSGDEIILSHMEHHANIVPWQLWAEKIGFKIHYTKLNENFEIDKNHLQSLLSPKTKLVSLVHISNALGVINPIQSIMRDVKSYNKNIITIVDISQSVVHQKFKADFWQDIDFAAFTGHKLYGPNGIGVLIGQSDILNNMSPYQGGGDMIETVSINGSMFKSAPAKFEAGTPAIAEVLGLGQSIEYLDSAFEQNSEIYEHELSDYMMKQLSSQKGITLYAPRAMRCGIISFNIDGIHPSDVAMTLDQMGIAVRTGHHCCMPLMDYLGVTGTVRTSLGLYSQSSDVDALIMGIEKTKSLFGIGA